MVMKSCPPQCSHKPMFMAALYFYSFFTKHRFWILHHDDKLVIEKEKLDKGD